MKIIRIRLRNLNSLRGDIDINLEDEPFSNSGIFAITGPTGAGKSTILDAITLALYGRAARYGNEKPENMMSRGTGDCQAEVIFEVPKGRYKASWHLQRAHKKADGKLQHPQRFVHDSEGAAIAQKSSEVDKVIEELTGLDADRFFRSVLLAQGDFVKFLKATPDQRATLLESLTGTGIYTEISMKVHLETSVRTHKLALREKDLANILRLNAEERAALIKKIEESKKQIENDTHKLNKLTDLIALGTQLIKYRSLQSSLASELAAINKENESLETDSKRLKLYHHGIPYFAELQSFDHAFKTYLEAKHERDGENNITNFSAEKTLKSNILEGLNQWLELHREDQHLDQNLSLIVEQITSLTHFRHKVKELLNTLSVNKNHLTAFQQNLKIHQSEKNNLLTLLKTQADSLQIVKNEHDIVKDELDKNRLVASFHEHRESLESGKPCPLCGSLDHPYLDSEKIVLPTISDLKTAINGDEIRLLDTPSLLKLRHESSNKVSEIEKSLFKAQHSAELVQNKIAGQEENIQSLLGQIEKVNGDLQISQKESSDLEVSISKYLTPYSLSLPPAGEEKKLRETLESQKNAYKNNLKLSIGIKDELNALNVCAELEAKLSQKLIKTPFTSIDALRAAQLMPSEIERIQGREADIKRKRDHCLGQLAQVENELKGLSLCEAPQGEALKEISNQHSELITKTNDLRGVLAISERNLQQDEKNHLAYEVLSKEIETERKRLSIWQKLANLIGSHDGRAFRKFAQGLSLDLLIRHANIHLGLLSNRYRLKRMPGEELDLEIQDLHQANATRPTASLSGGESFLTSLALALGLSDLAGKNVRIDSLFIDEGFGSLDSEALEIAVQALESLRSKNKTIGVISHVELLKERIPTQIVIDKRAGGVSRVTFSS